MRARVDPIKSYAMVNLRLLGTGKRSGFQERASR